MTKLEFLQALQLDTPPGPGVAPWGSPLTHAHQRSQIEQHLLEAQPGGCGVHVLGAPPQGAT